MRTREDGRSWLLVAWNILHLNELAKAQMSWWCVDRRCKVGDKCFVYKPSKGIVLLFEIKKVNETQAFCRSFGMATAEMRILKVFDPPITAKEMKQSDEISLREANFIKRSFQGKAFSLADMKVVRAILKLGASKRK